MDDALPVDTDVDVSGRYAEEVVRLDHLQPFIHHRGGVDRHLAAHIPVGIPERLLGGHLTELLHSEVDKWSPRGGEVDLGDIAMPLADNALIDGGVL